jgi:hypothetical protein
VCRGWLQIFFTRNPMAMGGLSLGQRLVYLGACWAYVSHIFAAPLMVAVPFIGAVLGVLPFELNRSFAAAALVHTGAGYVIHMLCAKPHHIKNLWFAAIAPQLFWYSYLHAAVSALFSTTGSRNTRKTNRRQPASTAQGSESPAGFKATIDLSDLEETKDIYFIFTWAFIFCGPVLCVDAPCADGSLWLWAWLCCPGGQAPTESVRDRCGSKGAPTAPGWRLTLRPHHRPRRFLLVSICTAAISLFQLGSLGAQPNLLFLLFWSLHNCVAPGLYIHYKLTRGETSGFRLACWLGLVAAFLMAALALLMLWLVRPELDLQQALSQAMFFYKAQVGCRVQGCRGARSPRAEAACLGVHAWTARAPCKARLGAHSGPPTLPFPQKSGVLVNQNNPVGWRGDSALQDAGGYALQGGFYDGAAPGPGGASAAGSTLCRACLMCLPSTICRRRQHEVHLPHRHLGRLPGLVHARVPGRLQVGAAAPASCAPTCGAVLHDPPGWRDWCLAAEAPGG